MALREEVVMRFTDPWYALLLLPVLAGLWASWGSVHGMAKGRKRFAFAVRAVLAALLVLALAGPQSRRPNQGMATVFVVDRSDSVQDAERDRADAFVREAMQKLGPDDMAGVVAFGATPLLDSAPGGRRDFPGVQSKVDGSASDIAAAIRLASASFPEGKARRIVMLTDGNETRGDLMQAAEVAASEGVPLDFFALGIKAEQREASVVELSTPSERRAAEPFEARVVVESTVQQRATLVIDRDGAVVSRQPVLLDKGKTSIVLDQRLEDPGFYRYRATLEPEFDSDRRNNIGASFTTVRGKPRVLVLQGSTNHQDLAQALSRQGLDVDLRGGDGVPVRAEDLQPYDAVFLNDLDAKFMGARQMQILRAAARDTGIGLAMVGGEGSFLPGGWYGTPVADALPVDLNVRQRKSFPSTTVLVIADASGSMAMPEDGVQKIQLAAKAAEETVKLLSAMDRVGVAGSADGIELVAPIQPLKDKPGVISQIRKLRPGGGGIYAEPSMQFAQKQLLKEDTKVRHFILLADGADVDTYGNSLAIVRDMFLQKVTTSVVSIGDGKDVPFLKQLAAAGGGRFYLTNKASKLPAIFTQDVAVMSRSAIEEITFVPEMRSGEEALRGFAPSELPALFAYCLADVKPLARASLLSPKKDPVFVTWQYGLARTLAFTSDAQSRWAARWVQWPGFGRFWGQAARSIARRSTQNDYQFAVAQDGGKGRISLKATDRLGNPLPASQAEVTVSSPTGESQSVSLNQEAPGVFSGNFKADELGSYIVSVAESAGGGAKRIATSGFSIPYPPEYRQAAANSALLTAASALTGGEALARPVDALRPVPNPGETLTDLWPWFLLASLLLLPFDVGVRRVALPLKAILAGALARLHPNRAPQTAPETMARLRQAKSRVTPAEAGPTAGQKPPAPAPRVEPRAGTPHAPQDSPPGSTAGRLLDAKRQKRAGRNP
ncbi:MAG: VWA domain-containing protein [Fimbriimonadaceae bacterium]|nr:MAG: VWA domain-containing protein [Fimbriimonadaceae bacterium]